MLVAALIGGGGLWVVTNGLPGAAPAGVIGPTATTPAPAPTTRVLPTATGRAAATSMATEINLDESPHGIAVDPESRLAFIANYNDSSVSVVNLDSNSIVRKLSVGAQPQNVLVDTASGLLLVGCDGVPAVQIYDLRGYNLVGSVSTGKGPIRMAVHSAQRVAYAVAQGSSKMEVISLTNYKLVKTVEVGKSPRVVAVDERGDIAYVGHWDSTLVSMVGLGTQQKVGELTVGRNPNGIAIAAEGRKAFVASFGDGKDGGGSVSVIDLDTRKVVKTLGVDSGPSRVVVDESASVAYVSCLYAARIDVIDTTSLAVVDRVETAKRPTGVAVDASNRIYVSNSARNVVNRIVVSGDSGVVSDFAGDVFRRGDWGFEWVDTPDFTLASNVATGGTRGAAGPLAAALAATPARRPHKKVRVACRRARCAGCARGRRRWRGRACGGAPAPTAAAAP